MVEIKSVQAISSVLLIESGTRLAHGAAKTRCLDHFWCLNLKPASSPSPCALEALHLAPRSAA